MRHDIGIFLSGFALGGSMATGVVALLASRAMQQLRMHRELQDALRLCAGLAKRVDRLEAVLKNIQPKP